MLEPRPAASRPRPRLLRRLARPTDPVPASSTPPSAPPPPVARVPATQIIPGSVVDWFLVGLIWFALALMFGVGVVGNLVTVDLTRVPLGWAVLPWLADHALIIAAALIYQLVIQLAQFGARRRWGRSSRPYILLILLSIVPSCWTYGAAIWRVVPPGGFRLLCLVALPVILFVNDRVQDDLLVAN